MMPDSNQSWRPKASKSTERTNNDAGFQAAPALMVISRRT